MNSEQQHDPGVHGSPILHEADIGSGERTPAQHETDQMIKEIPPLAPGGNSQQGAGDGGSQQSDQQSGQQSSQQSTRGSSSGT